MAGLLYLALHGIMRGFASIAEAKDNAERKSNLFTLGNGVKFYYDRKGIMRLTDGTRVYREFNGAVKTPNGRVIFDPEKDEYYQRVTKPYEEAKKHNATYFLYYPTWGTFEDRNKQYGKNRAYVKEVATNKAIVGILKIEYLSGTTMFKKFYYEKESSYYWDWKDVINESDKGIVISEEEYNAIENAYLKLTGEEYIYSTDSEMHAPGVQKVLSEDYYWHLYRFEEKKIQEEKLRNCPDYC